MRFLLVAILLLAGAAHAADCPRTGGVMDPDADAIALRNRRDETCNAAIVEPGVPILPLDGMEQLRQTLAEIDR